MFNFIDLCLKNILSPVMKMVNVLKLCTVQTLSGVVDKWLELRSFRILKDLSVPAQVLAENPAVPRADEITGSAAYR